MPRRRDAESRNPDLASFRFAIATSLVRYEGYPLPAAKALIDGWARYVRYALASGKSPTSTAEHLARFEHFQASPWRDPQARIRVPEHVVDAAIADDLQDHALRLLDEDPEHAEHLFAMSEKLTSRRPASPPPRAAQKKKPSRDPSPGCGYGGR